MSVTEKGLKSPGRRAEESIKSVADTARMEEESMTKQALHAYAKDIQRLHNQKRIVGYVTEEEIPGIVTILRKLIREAGRSLPVPPDNGIRGVGLETLRAVVAAKGEGVRS